MLNCRLYSTFFILILASICASTTCICFTFAIANVLIIPFVGLVPWQSVRINNTYSSFQNIVSGVPQGSILGPILFNFYINDLLLFVKKAEVYNYADDNTLVYFSKTLPDLVKILEEGSNVALDWLESNEMIANPEKFNVLIVKKDRSDTSGVPIKLKDNNIQSKTNIKPLGIKLDNRLNFDPHIADLCKKAATQLNVLKRLKSFIGLEERKTLVESFIYSNFNYCPLVWHFSSAKSAQRVEKNTRESIEISLQRQ